MLRKLRSRLGPKDVTVVRLALWAGLVTWMVFFFAFGVIAAQRLASFGPGVFGGGLRGEILAWVAPIWVVFTFLLVIVLVARFANKRLSRREE